MIELLELRDKLKELYSEYDNYVNAAIKFILALSVLLLIQGYIGFLPALDHFYIVFAAAVFCSFFPWGMITFVLAVFILANMFEVSAAMTMLFFITSIIVFVLYFGFRPGNAIILALVPLCFMLKIPFVLPLILGLSVGAFSAVPASLGVLLWFFVRYFHDNAELLKKAGTQELLGSFTAIANGIFKDRYMLLVILSFILCILVVSIVSRLSIDHAWIKAVMAGSAVLLIIMVVMGAVFGDTSIIFDIIGMVISVCIAVGYVYFFHGLDYRRVERIQFEDDDYYYYVKAVPKLRTMDETEYRQ